MDQFFAIFSTPFFATGRPLKKAIAEAALIVVATVMMSCATTRLDSQWMNPDFSGTKLKGKVFIVGISSDDLVRRLYEDEMAAQLQARSLTTVRSYDVIAAPLDKNGHDALLRAAREGGANMVLSSAVIAREQIQSVVSEPMPSFGYENGFGGWYSYNWPLYGYAPAVRTEISQHSRYTISTSLTDTVTGKIVWSARTQTEDVESLNRGVKTFVKVIVDTMIKSAVL